MGQFNHPHVVKLYGVVTLEDPVSIVLESSITDNDNLYPSQLGDDMY